MRSASPVFIGWPNEGIEYWNGYWRRRGAEGFFDATSLTEGTKW